MNMNDKKLLKFKTQLEEMKEAINADAERTLSEMTTQNVNIPDPNDRATIESDRNFELRIRDRERKLMNKVEKALARIDDGSFGTCDDCGEDIADKRLEARPVAKFCIDCKTKQEQREKAQGK
jgi:DnaK suppressor protein